MLQAQLGLANNINSYSMDRELDSLEKAVRLARMTSSNRVTDALLAGLVQMVDLIYSNQQPIQQMAVTPEPDVDPMHMELLAEEQLSSWTITTR